MKRRTFLTLAAGTALAACSGRPYAPAPIAIWDEQGLRDGAFLRPRAIGVHNGEVYVIDTTGRIQVFTPTGELLRIWSTPKSENGTPTAITFHDGKVIIPDTHYSRILEYTPDGELLHQWGSYGNNPGEFIYPTGLAVDSDGTFFICEYGEGAERVQVFSPEHKHLRQWGTLGPEPGAFSRAMALDLTLDGNVCVADTANHRVQIFNKSGDYVATHEADQGDTIKYPHDLAAALDDSIYIAEYGNNRITRIASNGAFHCVGTPGRAPGSFNAPRGVAVADGKVYVADTDNHRVQVFPEEAFA